MPRSPIKTEFLYKTTLEQLWAALSEAEHLQNWFPTIAQVTPGVGGTITYQWDDSEFKGTADIVDWEPCKTLITHEHHLGPNGKPLTLRTAYHLSEEPEGVRLRLVQSGFEEGEGWDDYAGAFARGWAFELRGLGYYLENAWGKARRTIWARRQVKASLEDAWLALTNALRVTPELDRAHWLGQPMRGKTLIWNAPMDLCADLTQPLPCFLRIKMDGWGQPDGVQDIHLFLSLFDIDNDAVAKWQQDADDILSALPLQST